MGLFSKVGGLVNDLLGGTTSAKQQQTYSAQLANLNNMYQKETMQNMHQWETEDLKKAGLNPILSANGNTGALSTASPSGASSGTGGNPLDMIATAINYGQQMLDMDKTSAEKSNIDETARKTAAETANLTTENKYLDKKQQAEIRNLNANTALNTAKAANTASERALNEAQTKFTNERARGFSKTTQTGGGANVNMLGFGHGSNSAKMESASW